MKGEMKFIGEVGLTEEEKSMMQGMVLRTKKLYKKSGSLLPTFFITNSKTKEMHIVGGVFKTQEEKEKFVHIVKDLIKKLKANGVMGILEAWTLPPEVVKDFMANRDKYPSVSSHPEAYDAIFFSYENRRGTWMLSVKCDPKAKSMEMDNLEFVKADRTSGLMSNFIHLKEVLN